MAKTGRPPPDPKEFPLLPTTLLLIALAAPPPTTVDLAQDSLASPSPQDTANHRPLPGLFDQLGTNALHSFSGRNLWLQTGAIASTYGIVQAGWDYDVHHLFYTHQNLGTLGSPSAALGGLAPILLAGGLWSYGAAAGQPEIVVAGHAVAQAVALSFTYHELLKAVTGRPAPQGVPESQMLDYSRNFRFGLLRGGLFWGWPSGHLATNTAAITALSAFYPDNNLLAAAKYAWISYMFYGVTSHNGASMHWFSDAVAGTLMGLAFGQTVGSAYHQRLHPAPVSKRESLRLYPTAIAGVPGMVLELEL